MKYYLGYREELYCTRHSEVCVLVEAVHLGCFSSYCLLANVQPQYVAEEKLINVAVLNYQYWETVYTMSF